MINGLWADLPLVQKRQFASDVRRLFASDYGATPKPSTQMTQKRSASYTETTQMVQLFASHLYTVRRKFQFLKKKNFFFQKKNLIL